MPKGRRTKSCLLNGPEKLESKRQTLFAFHVSFLSPLQIVSSVSFVYFCCLLYGRRRCKLSIVVTKFYLTLEQILVRRNKLSVTCISSTNKSQCFKRESARQRVVGLSFGKRKLVRDTYKYTSRNTNTISQN